MCLPTINGVLLMAEFTKEELIEILKIQERTSKQLADIVNGLTSLGENQKKILGHLENGLSTRIVGSLEKSCIGCRGKIDSIDKSVLWLKIFLGLVGMTAFVGLVIKLMHN